MSNAADLGTDTIGSSGPWSGMIGSYGPSEYDIIVTSQQIIDIPYQGYDTNFFAADTTNVGNVTGGNVSQGYFGFTTNYGGDSVDGGNTSEVLETFQMDNEIVYPYPKDQQIYYKLRGFNTNNLSYETWIISERIVPRLEQFDPTGNPPSVDLNVFFKPPSGNTLSNIRIVGRWIQ